MLGPGHRRSTVRWGIAAALALLLMVSRLAAPDAGVSALSRWTGGVDLYRSAVFTTQQTWLWCTAADVQIIRNVADRASDHTKSGQQRYFDYMRARNRYSIPVSDGVDPAGWTAGLQRFVDGRYRLYQSGSFDSALRSAVTNLRLTNLPVGITVSHGNHAWVLTGFTATADPAATSRFTVTSVRVVGPLWGLQSRTYGYDMRPDTKLTPSQLKGFFTPWHYAGVRMAWEGKWVSVQPVGRSSSSPAAPTASSKATPRPTAKPTATPLPTASSTPQATPIETATATPAPPSNAAIGVVEPTASASVMVPLDSAQTSETVPAATLAGIGVLLVAVLAVVGGVAWRVRPRRPT